MYKFDWKLIFALFIEYLVTRSLPNEKNDISILKPLCRRFKKLYNKPQVKKVLHSKQRFRWIYFIRNLNLEKSKETELSFIFMDFMTENF